MGFEYDSNKSIANKVKHGIDFAEARELWSDPRLLEVPARTDDEPRLSADSGIGTGPRCVSAAGTTFGSSRCDALARGRSNAMKAVEFDRKFDNGEDIDDQVDWSRARRPNTRMKRVNVDFPMWMVEGLDVQARRLGITRQSLIKFWIAERLQ